MQSSSFPDLNQMENYGQKSLIRMIKELHLINSNKSMISLATKVGEGGRRLK